MLVYPVLAERIKPNKEGKRPKLYFQFWAFHILITVLGLNYIIIHNKRMFKVHPIMIALCFPVIILCHIVVYYYSKTRKFGYFISNCILSLFIFILLTLAPTVILIFYVYPVHTIIRLPFILNSMLYTNSLLALLFHHFKRIVSSISNKLQLNSWRSLKRILSSCISNKQKSLKSCIQFVKDDFMSFVQFFGTGFLLLILLTFIKTINDLLDMNLSQFTDRSQVEMLFTLVPTILLLFGSWYKLDLFLDIEKEKSEKEFLAQILQKMEKFNCRHSSSVVYNAQTSPASITAENERPNRGTDEGALDTSPANPATGEDNCSSEGMASGGANITQLQVEEAEVHPVVFEPDEHTQLLPNSSSINS